LTNPLNFPHRQNPTPKPYEQICGSLLALISLSQKLYFYFRDYIIAVIVPLFGIFVGSGNFYNYL